MGYLPYQLVSPGFLPDSLNRILRLWRHHACATNGRLRHDSCRWHVKLPLSEENSPRRTERDRNFEIRFRWEVIVPSIMRFFSCGVSFWARVQGQKKCLGRDEGGRKVRHSPPTAFDLQRGWELLSTSHLQTCHVMASLMWGHDLVETKHCLIKLYKTANLFAFHFFPSLKHLKTMWKIGSLEPVRLRPMVPTHPEKSAEDGFGKSSPKESHRSKSPKKNTENHQSVYRPVKLSQVLPFTLQRLLQMNNDKWIIHNNTIGWWSHLFSHKISFPPGVVEGRRSRRPSNPEPLPWRKGSKGRESNGRARSSSWHLANVELFQPLDNPPSGFYLHQYI